MEGEEAGNRERGNMVDDLIFVVEFLVVIAVMVIVAEYWTRRKGEK